MLVAINDMSISDCISAEFLAQHQEFIRGAKVMSRIATLVKRRWSGFWKIAGKRLYLLIRYRMEMRQNPRSSEQNPYVKT